MSYITKQYSKQEVSELVEQVNELPEGVQNVIWDNIGKKLSTYLELIGYCESPIEQMLVVPLFEKTNRIEQIYGWDVLDFSSQETVEADGHKYRVDFAIAITDRQHHLFEFVIECDGHDHHERTKGQARKDRERERALVNQGRIVIRFTGSEIYENAEKCAQEVYDIMVGRIRGVK